MESTAIFTSPLLWWIQVLSVKGGWTHPSMASQRGETTTTYCPSKNSIKRWKCYVIWAGTSLNERTALVVVPLKLNGRRYIDEILQPHVVLYLCQMGQNVIFQDENARPHRAWIMDNFLQLNGVQRLEWPPMSPDLSFIEHLWDIFGWAVNKQIDQHTRLADLQRLILQEWAAIPHRRIQRLVNSMRCRLNECRVNLGGYTHY